MKKIAILGSTGSIGTQTIEIIKQHKNYKIELIVAAGYKKELIINQCNILKPKYCFVSLEEEIPNIIKNLHNTNTKVLPLKEIENITDLFDVTIGCIAGFQGIKPTLKMVNLSKKLAIANKETILCIWPHLKEIANKNNCKIIPIDSEHNSLYQLLQKTPKQQLNKLIITASGGAFLNKPTKNVSVAEALTHPNWNMGKKNTIDSATLVNKGIELIEACQLFDLPIDAVEAIIHPESIVHAIVQMKNGFSMSLSSKPDMKLHINHSIFENDTVWHNQFDFTDARQLNFLKIDKEKFKGFFLSKIAFLQGINGIIKYVVSNEIAVNNFLNEKIQFDSIHKIIESILSLDIKSKTDNINEIIDFTKEISKITQEHINNKFIK